MIEITEEYVNNIQFTVQLERSIREACKCRLMTLLKEEKYTAILGTQEAPLLKSPVPLQLEQFVWYLSGLLDGVKLTQIKVQ